MSEQVYTGTDGDPLSSGGRAYTPDGPSVDARIEQVSTLSDDFLDRAFEKFSAQGEEAPVEPVEPVVPELPAEPDESERATFLEAGIDYAEAVAFLEQNPDVARHLIAEPSTDEELAHNARLLTEIVAGRNAQGVLEQVAGAVSEQQAEVWFEETAREALYDIDDGDLQGRFALAHQVADVAPAKLGEFLEEWGDLDPVGPQLFVRQLEQQAAEQQEAHARAVYGQQQRAAEAAQQQETLSAFEGALRSLAVELTDPTVLVDLTPDAAQLVSGMLERAQPGSPEEARQLVQLARRGTREIGEAREIARLLAPIDEAINRQGYRDGYHDRDDKIGSRYEPFDRARALAAIEREHIDPERFLPSGPSGFDRMLGMFDAELERQDANRREYDDGNSPTLRAVQDRRQARVRATR